MTIPASQLVNFIPNVLAAGGNALNVVGLMLTQNTRVPIGTVQEYSSAPDVSSALGASSVDAQAAQIYFGGFTGATVTPGQMLVAQYNLDDVSAYLRSASLADVTLTELQGMSGTLSVNIDGYIRSAAVVLSGATSFSQAAATIATDLNTASPTLATYTASIADDVMTVTGTLTGTLSVGQTVTGSNTTPNSIILSQLSGDLNGTGTYQLSQSTGTVSAQVLTSIATELSVSFDSVTSAFIIESGLTGSLSTAAYATGSLATSLRLTQALGAVLSQGAVAAVPATFMAGIIRLTTNWVTLFTNFDPDQGDGNDVRTAFSAWTSSTSNRYAYLAGDNDVNPTLTVPATQSLGQKIKAAGYSGTSVIWDPDLYKIPAFIAGAAASIDFSATNGRITFAYKGQSGLTPTVTDGDAAQNLLNNNYSFYGAYATANNQFLLYQNGSVSGPYSWLDSYINQIWLNAQMQLTVLQFMANIKSVPYNQPGYTAIENALSTIIQQGLAFGAYSPGVTLSSAQIVEINQAAGANIANTLQTQGWYLQVKDPGPDVRAVRGSPKCNFWYVDGESVQLITFSSIAAQ